MAGTTRALRVLASTALAATAVIAIAPLAATAVETDTATVFINELHYDNTGTDTGELVEIAGPAGTDLSGWSIVRYNGSNGTVYGTDALSATLTDVSGGYGFEVVALPPNGLQNGAPDGVALVDPADTVVEFWSYEGVLTAADGPAAGQTSTDLGVAEDSSTPVGESLQRTGTGSTAADFAWQAPAAATPGAPSVGQTFDGGPSGPADPVLNEVGFSDAGPDDEFVEVFGDPATDYSGFTVLQIDGDDGQAGEIDHVVAVGTTDAVGIWSANVASNSFENGSSTFVLVEGFTGSDGDDLDTDDDGTFDVEPWTRLVDGVAVSGSSGVFYAVPVLDESFDDDRFDSTFAPGGLSRIPDGADTDTAADWYRNHFGWDGTTNTDPSPGEALNTPGAPNEIVPLPAPDVSISEIHYDNAGTDVGEFVEVEGDAGTDLTGWTIVLYNGNGGAPYSTTALSGTIDNEAGGRGAVAAAITGIQNGAPDGVALVDSNGALVEFVSYEGVLTATSGPAAGQTSTDIGVSETGSTPAGQSLQKIGGVWVGPADESPGDLNDGGGGGGPEPKLIHEIQGSSDASPLDGTQVTISAIVVGDFQEITTADPSDEPLDGFFVQEQDADADADPATSEGIFVFYPANAVAVSVGDLVEVTGTVDEFFGLTEVTNVSDVTVVSSGNPLPTPATPTVPTSLADAEVDWESIEGMSVSFTQPLFVSNTFPMGSFGEVGLSAIGPWDHPNQVAPVGSQAAADVRALNLISEVLLDDGEDENESFPGGLSTWNPTPTPYLGGPENTLRAGDVVNGLFGVVHYSFGEFEVQPVNLADPTDPDGGVDITRTARPSVPDVGGELQVASFNVQNYFVTLDQSGNTCGPPGNEQGCRGADTQGEFDIQSAKVADAIADLDADIVGLVEVENAAASAAVADLVARVNALSARTYDYIETGYIGTDAIAVGLIYDPAAVAPDGAFAILDSSVSPAFIDDKNRPALAQTFTDLASGDNLTIAVNHLKSKGSACDDVANPGDPAFGVDPYALGDDADVRASGDPLFTGNCDLTRTAAAKVLGGWIAQNPTGTASDNLLIVGDLNAYANEDPITALEGQGYTDLKAASNGGDTSWASGGQSFVFNGEYGTLDYGIANASLAASVTGAEAWHINADEPFAIDYQNFNPPGQATPDEWKASDHDPLLIGITFAATYECAGVSGTIAQLEAAGYNVIIGTERNNRIVGTRGNDFVLGLGGADRIYGLRGDDVVCGGDGNDRIWTAEGADRVDAGAGRDQVYAGSGADTVFGGDGRDLLFGGGGADSLFGEAGRDFLSGNGGNDLCDGGPGRDSAHRSCETEVDIP